LLKINLIVFRKITGKLPFLESFNGNLITSPPQTSLEQLEFISSRSHENLTFCCCLTRKRQYQETAIITASQA